MTAKKKIRGKGKGFFTTVHVVYCTSVGKGRRRSVSKLRRHDLPKKGGEGKGGK